MTETLPVSTFGTQDPGEQASYYIGLLIDDLVMDAPASDAVSHLLHYFVDAVEAQRAQALRIDAMLEMGEDMAKKMNGPGSPLSMLSGLMGGLS